MVSRSDASSSPSSGPSIRKTGLNIAVYPEFQFLFCFRSVFIPTGDFTFVDPSTKDPKTIVMYG